MGIVNSTDKASMRRGFLILALGAGVFIGGCGKSSAGPGSASSSASAPPPSESGASGSATASAVTADTGDSSAAAALANPIVVEGDPDAAKAVQTKLEQTWLPTPDGWITEYAAPINPGTGSPAVTGDLFWEFKELHLKVKTDQLTDIGKQTYEFHGACEITSFASRYFYCALDGSNGAGKWTEWSSVDPGVYFVVTKEKGQWKMQGGYDHNLGSILKASISDVTLWSGKKPDESTLANIAKSNTAPAVSAGGSEAAAPSDAIPGTGDPDAVNYFRTVIKTHWLQTPDGWISEYGSRGGVFREIKGLDFQVVAQNISEQDKQKGIEFRGSLKLPNATLRDWPDSDSGDFPPPARWTKRWSPVTEFVSYSIQKKNGRWEILPAWDWATGVQPDESTLASLGYTNLAPAGSAGGSEAAANPSTVPGTGDPDAVKVAQLELKKHWVKTSDGWISALQYYPYRKYTYAVPFDELRFLEIRDLSFDITPMDISDTDKLNGIQYHGWCKFADSSVRVFNQGGAAQWNQWADDRDNGYSLDILKVNGQWQIHGGEMTSGTVPDAQTLARLK
jgi:hypothetical protein